MAAKNVFIVLDIDKGTQDNGTTTYVNLTPHFQGRVADSLCTVNIQIRRHGLPMDLTKFNVGFQGIDPNGKRFEGVGWESYDLPGTNEQIGKVSYCFPAGMFQVEGQWDPDGTYFYVDDGKGMKVSTVGVCLNVQPDLVEIGVNAKPFETDMDRAVAELKSYADKKMQEIGDLTERFDQLQGAVSALKSQLSSYTDLINSKAVPTINEMHDYAKQLGQGENLNGNLDNATDPKVYIVSAGTENSPSKTDGVLRTFGNRAYMVQVFIDSNANEFVRAAKNGVWGIWITTTQFPTDAEMYPTVNNGGNTTSIPISDGTTVVGVPSSNGSTIGGGTTTIVTNGGNNINVSTKAAHAAAFNGNNNSGISDGTVVGTLPSNSGGADADKYGDSIVNGGSVVKI